MAKRCVNCGKEVKANAPTLEFKGATYQLCSETCKWIMEDVIRFVRYFGK